MMDLTEVAFFTTDVPGMTSFYERLLGKPPEARSEGMAIFALGSTKLFIHRVYDPEEGDLPPENHIAYTVDDVDSACDRLAEHGLTVEVAPRNYYWGRSAYLRDPDRHLIELIEAQS